MSPTRSGAGTTVGPVDRSLPYPSCEWLESGLAFNRRSLHACLIVHHGRGLPKLCDYNGGELPWDEVLTARHRIILENQDGGHPACAGCPNLVERHWPAPRYPVQLVGIAQFARCNIFCSYCFLQTQDPASYVDGLSPYPVAPAIDQMIREGLMSPDATVDWGGGEPTIYREFDELLTRVAEMGGTTWIHTNGTRFPAPLAGGLPSGKVGVICSVDAGFPDTYRRMKGRDFLERVWRNLARYVEAGCDVHLKYIVKEENCSPEELRAFADRAAGLGARQLIVDLDYDYPDPSPPVLEGIVLLRRLAEERGIPATFGATGAQMWPELDRAQREWDRPARGRWESVKTSARKLLPIVRTTSTVGRSTVRPDPESVFALISGFTLLDLPSSDESLADGLQRAFAPDPGDFKRMSGSTAARVVSDRTSHATLLAVRPDGPPEADREALEELGRGFATATGCSPTSSRLEGEPVFQAASEQLGWIAFAVRRLLFVVLGTELEFTKRVAGSVIRQLGRDS